MKLLATLLFILLSPGLLLTIPPIGGVLYRSGKTSVAAILVHAVLFYLILMFHDSIPLINQIEGFQGTSGSVNSCASTKGKGAGCPCLIYTECASGMCNKTEDPQVRKCG